MTLTIECSSFTATPIGGGRMVLDIVEAVQQKDEGVYSGNEACERLAKLMGKPVKRHNLVYWRESLGLPYKKVGPKKFLYAEEDLCNWVKANHGPAF